jgi:hypothetical protein
VPDTNDITEVPDSSEDEILVPWSPDPSVNTERINRAGWEAKRTGKRLRFEPRAYVIVSFPCDAKKRSSSPDNEHTEPELLAEKHPPQE